MKNSPLTQAAYTRLQQAYDCLNSDLFRGELPPCLMTWQRKDKTMGYFSANRFKSLLNKPETHEIALNPDHFDSDVEVLQTLAHEMVHLWQFVFGEKTAQRTYHNAEWGRKMEAIGLMPSDTGKPGGKKCGQKMADYPIPGGAFESVVTKFLSAGPVVEWRSVPSCPSPAPSVGGAMPEMVSGEEIGEPTPQTSRKTKVKYICPVCGAKAWGKPELNLICGDHTEKMTPSP